MIGSLSPNTQAILLLTAPLISGRGETSSDLLSLRDYNTLARILREKQKQPADLIGAEAKDLLDACSLPFARARVDSLLARGFALSKSVDHWNSRAIWVISRADPQYPKRLKARLREDAPPLLYGCGDIELLEKGGLAVVGSRHTTEYLTQYTEDVGRLCAEADRSIVSGAAKGIDQAAMRGALEAGGEVAGVMADSLERAALARDNRRPLMDERLVLVSPYDPGARFNVGHAMQRNKLIYALADAALVVTSDYKKGGTWTGALEQLERLRMVPVFVLQGDNVGKGNSALLEHGGIVWPGPESPDDLKATLTVSAESFAAEPQQDMLRLKVSDNEGVYQSEVLAEKVQAHFLAPEAQEPDTLASPDAELMNKVRELLLRELAQPQTDAEVASLLSVTKAQAKAWLERLVEESALEKLKKPIRYRTIDRSEMLL